MVAVQRVMRTRTSPEAVVEYLADFAHTESWDPGTKSCTRIDDGPAGEPRWRNVSVFRGNETELTYTLVTRTPERLVFRGENKTVTSTDDLSFTALPEGGTEITYLADLDFHGIVKLAGPFLKGEFEKLGDEVAQKLPAVLDQLPT
jgi:carbon monoxide dehydrogenase subunit G